MTKTQVEVITSVQRRRRWSRAEKERIVAAAIEPGAVASEVARAAGIARQPVVSLAAAALRTGSSAPAFSAVAVVPSPNRQIGRARERQRDRGRVCDRRRGCGSPGRSMPRRCRR